MNKFQPQFVKRPRHIVFLDHLTESVVVSIRGTGSISDVLTDLHLDSKPFDVKSIVAACGNPEEAAISSSTSKRSRDVAADPLTYANDTNVSTQSHPEEAPVSLRGMVEKVKDKLEQGIDKIKDSNTTPVFAHSGM